jgi:hypothetical protein
VYTLTLTLVYVAHKKYFLCVTETFTMRTYVRYVPSTFNHISADEVTSKLRVAISLETVKFIQLVVDWIKPN